MTPAARQRDPTAGSSPLPIEYTMVRHPTTNVVYIISSTDRNAIFYLDPSTTTVATKYLITSGTSSDLQDMCVKDNSTLLLLAYDGAIIQVGLDSGGTPTSSQSVLTGSTSRDSLTQIAYDPTTSTILVCQALTTFYTFSSPTYTALTATNLPGCSTFMRYIGSHYYVQRDNIFYRASITGTTISGTAITTFPDLGLVFGEFELDTSGTLWMAYYNTSGGTSSKIYYITNFLTRTDPQLAYSNWNIYYDSSYSPQPDGFYAMTLSSPSLNLLYVNNYDNGTNFAIGLSEVPCLTGEMEVLTPSGYARVDSLNLGDTVVTPRHRPEDLPHEDRRHRRDECPVRHP